MIGRVYCIRSHQTTDIYIGSTIRILSCRMSGHRAHYKHWLNKKGNYVTSYEILKYEDAYIELVEEGEFVSKQEMQKREGHFIREMECVNKVIAGRTRTEWYVENAEQINEKRKEYCVENADKIKEKNKEYRGENAEQIKKTQATHYIKNAVRLNEKQKKYYIENAEQILKYQKEYQHKNADKLKEYKKEYRIKHAEKITCKCGCIYNKLDKSHHLKTKKHLDFLKIE